MSRRRWRLWMMGCSALWLAGCDTLSYFSQAANGQWKLLRNRQPIEQLLADPQTDAELKRKLALIENARQWAVSELLLSSGDAYTEYVALGHPYVVWNVFAAEEFSVAPKQWCFPIAGCVPYRGYFAEKDALAYAATLQTQGYETYVAGVEAYSTLGWFDDPALSTFIRRSDASLVGLIFHELAHRTLYVQNDSTFNESFATVIEEEGLKRWLLQRQQLDAWHRYLQQDRYQQDFIALILDHRRKLETVYSAALSDSEKRAEKQRITEVLRQRYQTLRNNQWQGYPGYDKWIGSALNNAQLSTIATYHDHVPGFRALLAQCKQHLSCFHAEARRLAALPLDQRHKVLAAEDSVAN